jgi:hypothetical protein
VYGIELLTFPLVLKKLSTVASSTGTFEPAVPGGAITTTWFVVPQVSIAWELLVKTVTIFPNATATMHPRLDPFKTTSLPPSAGPRAGVMLSIFGVPGGYTNKTSVAGLKLQLVTVQTSTSTTPGFWATD